MKYWHHHSFFLQVVSQVSKYIACMISCDREHLRYQSDLKCQLRILTSICLWAWLWTIKFSKFSRSNSNHSHHQYLHQNSSNGLHHDFWSQYVLLTSTELLFIGRIIGIKAYCMFNIGCYMYASGSSTELPVTCRISNINLISIAI